MLRSGKGQQRRLDFRIAIGALNRDEKLMIAFAGFAHSQNQHAVFGIAGIKRAAGRFGQFKAGRQRHSEFGGFALDHRQVAKGGDAQLRITNRHDGLDV